MIATKSPRAIPSDTSRRAVTVSSPMLKARVRWSTWMMSGLLIMQRLYRIHVRGLARRIEPEENSHQRREQKCRHDGARADHRGPLRKIRNQHARQDTQHNTDRAAGDRERNGL